MKGPHLHFQLICRSRDYVFFEKRHVSTDAMPQNSAGDGIVYVTVGNSAFCLPLYLTGVHFRGELQHVGRVGE